MTAARTIRALGDRNKHVDSHTIWVDPRNTDHIFVGCDGGVYESWDGGQFWQFKANLPTLQFYDVDVDYAKPYYHVYGGTQDNFSWGGPAATRNVNGIMNSDWYVTTGGDGFVSRVDPADPDTVYAESQGGGLVRYNRKTGSRINIKPIEAKGEPPLRWNWDAPLIVSPHDHLRLYFGANNLFRSDDRGNTWKAISPDLTRDLDRNALPVMGKIWGPDAVAKNASTAFYGNISAVSESPKRAGLLFVGTDDGLIQVHDDEGAAWRKADLSALPEHIYVQRMLASQHDENVAYAALDNHQNGDFKPYLMKTADRGKTWTNISGRVASKWTGDVHRGGFRQSETPVRGHRIRSLFLDRRRRQVDAAARRAADHRGPRHGDPEARKRPGARDLRARILRARRLFAASHGDARDTQGRSGSVSGEECARVRAGVADRRARQGIPGREFLHRRQSPVRRHIDLLFARRPAHTRPKCVATPSGKRSERKSRSIIRPSDELRAEAASGSPGHRDHH